MKLHYWLPIALAATASIGLAQTPSPQSDALSINKSAGVIESETFKLDKDSAAAFPRFSPRNPRYVLRPGDVIALSFAYTPDFNRTVTVQPDGFVTLREVNDVKVSGLTVPQLRDQLAKSYANVLREPRIDIELKEFEKPSFIANGQFNKPGKYDMNGDITVTQAVALAGGFAEAAKHSNVLLFRRVSEDKVLVARLDVKKMLNHGDVREDIHMQPGDMLFVPQNFSSKLKSWVNPHLGVTARPY